MTNSLTGQMTDAANAKEATIHAIRQAVAYILKSETVPFKSEAENRQITDAEIRLLEGLQQLRVVDVALPVREFAERTKNDDLRAKVLDLVEEGKGPTVVLHSEKFADQLARAFIYEEIDPATAAEQNADVHDFLEAETGLSLKQVIPCFEEIQRYYPTENHKAGDFTFTILQMQDLDKLLIDRTNDYLQANQKDVALSPRFVKLVSNLEDQEIAADLINALHDQRIAAQQVALDLG